jgi:dynamin 1-like protein
MPAQLQASPSGSAKPRMLGSNLIAVVNEIHDSLASLDLNTELDLPQIAVVGSQSSGKSSVLEAVVGRDFLPRGSGIVTRCPLVLKLAQGKPDSPEWGEFNHKPGVKFDDFAKIRQEIEARTAQIAGGTSISSNPILLTVHSPHVLNLTLIDLPGLVTTAIGDQPKDIERQIKEMVQQFIRPENTIILAITPANADLANSVALKAARSVDPEFNRTIGVLTKLDLMDQGTNAAAILENRVVPLKRGWIGVVNRSQKAINENVPMADAKQQERDFFLSHADYRHLADRMGTDYLAGTMSNVLLGHIQRCIPQLRVRIDELYKKMRSRQEELGMVDETEDHASKLLNLLHNYTRDIQRSISGDASNVQGRNVQDELQGGARLNYILYEAFAKHVQSLRASQQLSTAKLRYVIRNSSGLQASFFPSNAAFLTLVREQITRLEEPALQCIAFVHDELRKICAGCAAVLQKRYPTLADRVTAIGYALLEDLRQPCMHHMKTWVQAETRHINTRNPQLLLLARSSASTTEQALRQQQGQPPAGAPGAPQPQYNQQQPGQPGQPGQQTPQQMQQQQQQQQAHHDAHHAASLARAAAQASASSAAARFELPSRINLEGDLSQHEAAEHAALREIVEGYFTICKDTLCDQNPKIIAYLLVQKLEDMINAALMKALFKEELFEELLAEAPQIAAQRKATLRMMNALGKAQGALDKVRDMPTQ